jgi:hypothetical protein
VNGLGAAAVQLTQADWPPLPGLRPAAQRHLGGAQLLAHVRERRLGGVEDLLVGDHADLVAQLVEATIMKDGETVPDPAVPDPVRARLCRGEPSGQIHSL